MRGKQWFFFVFFTAAMLSIPSLAKKATRGFRVEKMRLAFPNNPAWEIPENKGVHRILSQPFHYLNKGSQSYVFESEDGQYVIKLFRYDQRSLKRDFSRKYLEDKVNHLFNASKMAYDYLKEETGLLYIHLNVTALDLPILQCKDALRREYRFSLDQTRFVLQKKAKDFSTSLLQARKNPAEMKRMIDAFLDLLKKRTSQKIVNTDPSLNRNFGFLEGKAIEIDFGNYRFNPGLDPQREIDRYASSLRRWLQKNAPEWVSYLDEKRQA